MVLSDNSKGDIGWKKWLIAGWGFVECLLFGGLLYGWGSVVYVLKSEGIYADLCDDEVAGNMSYLTNTTDVNVQVVLLNTTSTLPSSDNITMDGPSQGSGACKGQDEKMALCFAIGSAMFCVGCAVLGQISFKYGTRVTRIISFVMFEAGALCLAFTSKENPWLIFPGLSLLGIGGLPVLVTNAQISNLFLVGSSAVVGLFSGGFDFSSAVMLLVKLVSDSGLTNRQTMFIIIAVAHLLILISTFFFLPKTVIQKTPTGAAKEKVVDGEAAEVGTELFPKNHDSDKKVPTWLDCVKNPSFISHVFWLTLLQLRFFYFMGTLNQYLNTALNEDQDLVSYFTNVCFYTLMSGLVFSFVSGIVYDFQKWMCRSGKSKFYRETMPAVLPLAIASGLSVLMSLLVLIPNQSVLYVTFIVLTIHRSFLYSLAAGFLSSLFPSDYFGLLYGVMIVFGGVFGLFQYIFFTWSKSYDGGMAHANICLLVLASLSFVHPVSLFYRSWRAERAARKEHNTPEKTSKETVLMT